MIETEQQRRWWFATHPEFSQSHPAHRNRKQGKHSDRVHPEQVDAYVNDRLKYERDRTAIDLLNLEKQIFGTKGEYAKTFQSESASDPDRQAWDRPAEYGSDSDNPFKLAGYNSVEGPTVLTWPTLEEFSQWPRAMVRAFFQWYDAFLANNPVLMDPDALERHHDFIRERIDYFIEAGLNIEEYTRILRAGEHRSKDEGGLHTGEGEGRGGWWNNEWRKFIKDNPIADKDKIFRKRDEMEKTAEERRRSRSR
jgi:hypothetical protein